MWFQNSLVRGLLADVHTRTLTLEGLEIIVRLKEAGPMDLSATVNGAGTPLAGTPWTGSGPTT
jgi:hypothetical protein